MAVDRAVKAVEDKPSIAMIRDMDRSTEAYYAKCEAMELAYEHLMIIALEDAEKWEKEINEIHEVKEAMKERWLHTVAQTTMPRWESQRRHSTCDAGGQGPQRAKIRMDLQPKELDEDSSRRQWSSAHCGKNSQSTMQHQRIRAHSLECPLDEMKHSELITQIVLMHCPVEDIKKEAKNENSLTGRR